MKKVFSYLAFTSLIFAFASLSATCPRKNSPCSQQKKSCPLKNQVCSTPETNNSEEPETRLVMHIGDKDNQFVVRNFKGKEFDLSAYGSAFQINNSDYENVTLTCKNGTLLNVSNETVIFSGTKPCTIILENMTLEFSGDLATTNVTWIIQGNCTLRSNKAGIERTLTITPETGSYGISIAAQSSLKLSTQALLAFENAGEYTIALSDTATSQLICENGGAVIAS